MSSSGLPTMAPPVNAETQEFWTATAQQKLLLKRCLSCATVIWYPRAICPACHSTDTEWFEATGNGRIYSFTVSRRGEGPWRETAPYVLAYVELDEGPRIMTNIVDCDIDALAVDQPVRVVFDDTGESNALVRFTPA